MNLQELDEFVDSPEWTSTERARLRLMFDHFIPIGDADEVRAEMARPDGMVMIRRKPMLWGDWLADAFGLMRH